MSCRIEISSNDESYLVRVAGRLTEAEAAELLAACAAATVRVDLDLSDLDGVDCVGLETLRRIRDRGGRLRDTPQYIKLQMESAD